MKIDKALKDNMFYGTFYNYIVMREIALKENTLESNVYPKYAKKYKYLIKEGIEKDENPKNIAEKILFLENQ